MVPADPARCGRLRALAARGSPVAFDPAAAASPVVADRADGQFKVLRLTDDPAFAEEFEAERDLGGVVPEVR